MPSKSNNLARFRAKIFNALSEPNRLKIIVSALRREMCVRNHASIESTPASCLTPPENTQKRRLGQTKKKGHVAHVFNN